MTHKRSPDSQNSQLLPNYSFRDSYRHRQILLNKVRNYWIAGVLEKSLHSTVLIELGLEERLDATQTPWGVAWETPNQPRQNLPGGTKIIDKFDEIGEGRTLLILGEPGSGKTTSLLQLARDLVDRAEQDINQPIPVVFNLSSWVRSTQTITDWLVAELNAQYQIPQPVGQTWIKTEQLLLLLDGLDEVKEDLQASCIQALNQFSSECGRTEIVVCSRWEDYARLPERLKMQGAIYLQPLGRSQVLNYLNNAGPGLEALSTLLEEDRALQELATTPLMLSILTLAYQGMSAEDFPKNATVEERRKHLFDAYIQRMFARRGMKETYSQAKSLRWLTELALRMSQQSQTVFLIERLQPSWLRIDFNEGWKLPFSGNRPRKTRTYQAYGLGVQLSHGLVWGLIFSSIGLLTGRPIIGLIGGAIGGVSTKLEPIEPVETLKWSWKKTKQLLPWGLLLGASALASGVPASILMLWFAGVALIVGLSGDRPETTTVPNQGIWQSLKNASLFALTGNVLYLIGLAGLAGLLKLPDPVYVPVVTGGIFSGIVGLVLGMLKGGSASVQHLVLRLVLYVKGYSPWNYARFLNYAAERTFLQKVGGGYIFTHRLLQEHLAMLGVKHYLQNVRINPSDVDSYLKRAEVRASLGDKQGAIADYSQAIQVNPDLVEAYAGRSLVRYQLGDYQGVLDDYNQIVENNPTLAQAMSYTASDATSSTANARVKTLKLADQPYLVTLQNDDFNTFDHVYHCLMKYIPEMTRERAWTLTNQVHNEGQAVVWSGSQELANLYRQQLSHAGLSMDLCWPEITSSS